MVICGAARFCVAKSLSVQCGVIVWSNHVIQHNHFKPWSNPISFHFYAVLPYSTARLKKAEVLFAPVNYFTVVSCSVLNRTAAPITHLREVKLHRLPKPGFLHEQSLRKFSLPVLQQPDANSAMDDDAWQVERDFEDLHEMVIWFRLSF